VTIHGRVWIPEDLVDFLFAEAKRCAPNETGGVLLGYFARHPRDVVVTDVIGPGPNAFHGVDRFVPDYDYQDAEVARLYEESKRRITYLGDWHSHPNGGARLSRADRRTLRRIATSIAARAPEPLMMILDGTRGWAPFAWQGRVAWKLAWLPRFIVVPAEVELFRSGSCEPQFGETSDSASRTY
jgi:integrative and conjugative element protein (TIGR02256 family)